MTNITYRQLLVRLQQLTEEQLDMDLTVRTHDEEFFGADFDVTDDEDDVLDANHPIVVINDSVNYSR